MPNGCKAMFTKTHGNLTGIALATAAAGMFASADVSATGGQSVANSHSLNSCRGHGFVSHSACRTVVNSCRTHFISCHAFHRHFRSSVVIIGSPFFYYPYPYLYPYPYYYYPPMSYAPPAYAGGGGEPSPAYWYYCDAAKAYYPYVKECPGGWQQVMPQPPPPSGY